jgi:hypothetical protein
MNISQVLQRPRTQWAHRCHAVEEMLRSSRRRDGASVPPLAGPADPMGLPLEMHLLRLAQELAEAMLALRPSSGDDRGPDIRTAYDRLHRAMNDVAALYQHAQVQAILRARNDSSARTAA